MRGDFPPTVETFSVSATFFVEPQLEAFGNAATSGDYGFRRDRLERYSASILRIQAQVRHMFPITRAALT